jgi:cell division protein FtsB
MIAVCLVSLLTLNLTINAINKKAEEARKEAARLEYENSQLEDKVDGLGSAGSVEDIAQGELGMVPGDSVVIQPGQ